MRLTNLMREALEAAHATGEIRRVHDGQTNPPAWPHPPQTLNALVNRGLLEAGERRSRRSFLMQTWSLTDEGREALFPTVRPRRDSFQSMRAKGRATTRVNTGGVWKEISMPEPEKVPARHLNPDWQAKANGRHLDARTPRQIARDLTAELKRIQAERRAA